MQKLLITTETEYDIFKRIKPFKPYIGNIVLPVKISRLTLSRKVCYADYYLVFVIIMAAALNHWYTVNHSRMTVCVYGDKALSTTQQAK